MTPQAFHARLAALKHRTIRQLQRMWASADRARPVASWNARLPSATALVAVAQILAAELASDYLAEVAGPGPELDPEGFAGAVGNAAPTGVHLALPAHRAETRIRAGTSAGAAWEAAG